MKGSLAFRCLLLVVVLAGSSCASDDDVRGSEAQFEAAFVEPLDESGLDYSVLEACHYAREDSGEPWHLQVSVVIDADTEAVADVLMETVDIIERDRSPMIVQQYAGEPGRGWNGILDSQDEGSVLGVVKNNVDVDGGRPPVGWLPVCVFEE